MPLVLGYSDTRNRLGPFMRFVDCGFAVLALFNDDITNLLDI